MKNNIKLGAVCYQEYTKGYLDFVGKLGVTLGLENGNSQYLLK